MTEVLYKDDEVVGYMGGDPRIKAKGVDTELFLSVSKLSFRIQENSIDYEKASVHSVRIDDKNLLLLIVKLRDPEGVEPDGFNIRFRFRNDYLAKVFGKRIEAALGVPFSSETK